MTDKTTTSPSSKPWNPWSSEWGEVVYYSNVLFDKWMARMSSEALCTIMQLIRWHGKAQADASFLAGSLHWPIEEVRSHLAELAELGLISPEEDGTYKIHLPLYTEDGDEG